MTTTQSRWRSLQSLLLKTTQGGAVLAFIAYYFLRCACRGQIQYYKDLHLLSQTAPEKDNLTLKALRRVRDVLNSWYLPNPLLINAYAQSILACFVRSTATGLTFDREFIATPDGGTIAISWVSVENVILPEDAPILFVLPGTNGDELTSWYLHLACKHATATYGFRVVVYVRRGCNLPMSNGRPQDYADPLKSSGDMTLAIESVRRKYPTPKMAAVGYSLGGNFLANYLGSRANAKCDFVCGASVCGPYDITGLSYMLEFHYPVVDWYLRKSKAECLQYNRYVIESDTEAMRRGVDIDGIVAAKSFRAQCELDNLLVWGESGETLNRYLDRCSCSNRVENIKIPCLFLASLDDPVSHDLFIPYEKLKALSLTLP